MAKRQNSKHSRRARPALRNLAAAYVTSIGSTVTAAKLDYDGCCIDFAGTLLAWLGRGRLAYFETPAHPVWRYHAAAVVDGIVHDLWSESPAELETYAESIGAESVEFPAEDED